MVHVHGGEDEDDGGGVQLNYRLLIAEEEEWKQLKLISDKCRLTTVSGN